MSEMVLVRMARCLGVALLLSCVVALCASPARSQGGNLFQGMGPSAAPIRMTAAQLAAQACSVGTKTIGRRFTVTNAATTSTCAGTGSSEVTCVCTGAGWVPENLGGPPTGAASNALTGTYPGPGLAADAVGEANMSVANAPVDEYCLTYEATGGIPFEWQACGVGGGSGDLTEVTSSDGSLDITSGTGPVPDIILGSTAVQTNKTNIMGVGSNINFSLGTITITGGSSCTTGASQMCFDTNGPGTSLVSPVLQTTVTSISRFFPSWQLSDFGTAGVERLLTISPSNTTSQRVLTGTPTANAVPLADGTGKLADGWLSSVVVLSTELDTEAEVRTSGLKVMPIPDGGVATGQSVKKGATAFEAFTPITDAADLTGMNDPDNLDAALVTVTYAGTPTGNVACDATAPSELYRKFVHDTTNGDLYVCTGTGVAAVATWALLSYSDGTPDNTYRINNDNSMSAPVEGSGIIIDGGSGTDVGIQWSAGYGALSLNPPTEATFGGGLAMSDGANPMEWPWLWLSPSNFDGSSGSGNPGLRLCDPDADQEGDGCIEIEQNCQNVTASSEDCNAVFYQRSNGARQAMITISGDETGGGIARVVFSSGVHFTHHIFIPHSANPDLTGSDIGRMTVDETELQLLLGDGSGTPQVHDQRRQRDYSIQSPTARTLGFYKAYAAETIATINCITDTGTATLSLQECDATGSSCSGVDGATEIVCDSNNQADDGSLSNPSIDTGDWVKIVISAVASSPTDLAISVGYKMTRK